MSRKRPSDAVYPVPQEMEVTGKDVRVDRMSLVLPEGTRGDERFPADLFRHWVEDEFLVKIPVAGGVAAGGGKKIVIATAGALRRRMPRMNVPIDVPRQAEGYTVCVRPEGVFAVGRDTRGTLYAVATMMQLAELRGDGLYMPEATIRDWPYMAKRYVHLYVPGRAGILFFKRYVRDFLLRYKFNGIILEMGGGVRLDSHPEIATGWKRTEMELYAHGDQVQKVGESGPLGPGRRFQDTTHRGIGGGSYIDKEDLLELVRFARAHGQDVVPEIQSLSHVYHLACPHREIAELPHALFPDAYCPSNPKSYKLLFDVMDELIDVIRPENVHIGHDEWRAAGLCAKCRKKDTGVLFANDVIRITRHLKSRGVGVWMWADHFVSGHNEKRRSHGRRVWYDYPSTEGAWKRVRRACPDIVLLNWSWRLRRRPEDAPDKYDEELHRKGFRFLYGNFNGLAFEGWPERSKRYDVLGAEVSSWCTMDEFEIGKVHIPTALYSINLLWSTHWPPKEEAVRRVMSMLPGVRERMKGTHLPPIERRPKRERTIDLTDVFNARLAGETWDLRGLRQGRFSAEGLACRLGKGAVVVRRPHQAKKRFPREVEIPVGRRFQSLVFLQSCTGEGRRPVHAGDDTFFPRESSELVGVYDVVFEDEHVLPAEVRYDENVSAWDAGLKGLVYHARCIVAGSLPDGSPLVIWGNEWTNPRPDAPIRLIRFRGTRGKSDAMPMLLGITGIDKVRLSDYRGKNT